MPAIACHYRCLRVLLFRRDIAGVRLLPFAPTAAVSSLSIIVVNSEIGTRAKPMSPDVRAALIGAALLSVLLFPTVAGALLARHRARSSQGAAANMAPQQRAAVIAAARTKRLADLTALERFGQNDDLLQQIPTAIGRDAMVLFRMSFLRRRGRMITR